jgi:hypothetical protein
VPIKPSQKPDSTRLVGQISQPRRAAEDRQNHALVNVGRWAQFVVDVVGWAGRLLAVMTVGSRLASASRVLGFQGSAPSQVSASSVRARSY